MNQTTPFTEFQLDDIAIVWVIVLFLAALAAVALFGFIFWLALKKKPNGNATSIVAAVISLILLFVLGGVVLVLTFGAYFVAHDVVVDQSMPQPLTEPVPAESNSSADFEFPGTLSPGTLSPDTLSPDTPQGRSATSNSSADFEFPGTPSQPVHPGDSNARSHHVGGGAAWLPEVEERFTASVYPSPEIATRKLLDSLVQRVTDETIESLSEIRIAASDTHEHSAMVVLQAVTQLSAAFPDARVSEHPAGSFDGAVAESSDLQIVFQHAGPTRAENLSTESSARYTLSARLVSAAGTTTETVAYVTKPWVADQATYLSQHPHRNDLIALSTRFYSTAEEARQSARENAVMTLVPEVTSKTMTASVRYNTRVAQWNVDDVQREIREQLTDGKLIRDQFSQQLITDHGEVWRHALLIDASTDRLQEIGKDIAKSMHLAQTNQSRQRRSKTLSLLFLLAGVGLVFWGLDGMTKGYYTWRLAAVVGVIALVVTVVLWS